MNSVITEEQQRLIWSDLTNAVKAHVGNEELFLISSSTTNWTQDILDKYKVIPGKPHSYTLGKTKNGNQRYLVLLSRHIFNHLTDITAHEIYYEVVKLKNMSWSAYKMHYFTLKIKVNLINAGVYLLQCDYSDENLLRIGQSLDIYKRFIQHTSSNPKIKLLGFINTAELKTKEDEAIELFAEYNQSNSWFSYQPEIINWFKQHPAWKPNL